jgi:hypothetical protein
METETAAAATQEEEVASAPAEELGTKPVEPETEAVTEEQEPETYEVSIERQRQNEDWKLADEARLDVTHKAGYGQAQRELQPSIERSVKSSERSIQLSTQVVSGVKGFTDAINRHVSEGTLTKEVGAEVVQGFLGQLKGLQEFGETAGRQTGFQQGVVETALFFGDYAGSAGSRATARYRAAIQRWDENGRPEGEPKKIVEALIADVRATDQAKIKRLEAQIEGAKGGTRSGQGPSMATSSAGGGRSDEELLVDPSTPIQQIKEIRARRRAG